MIACPSCHPPVGRPYSKKYRNAILGMITLAPRQITGNPSLMGSDCAWFRMVCGFAPGASATSTTESVSFVDSLIWSSVTLYPSVQLVRSAGGAKFCGFTPTKLHIARNSSALSGRVPERLGYKLPGLMFVPADMAEIDIPRCFMYFDRAFVALSI